jgi:hypothetical protein
MITYKYRLQGSFKFFALLINTFKKNTLLKKKLQYLIAKMKIIEILGIV